MTRRTLVRNATVVTVDDEIGNLYETDVLIEDDVIAAIGKNLPDSSAETIDATGCILMPGMIDTHRHLWQTCIRGVFADWSTLQYMQGIRLHIAPLVTAEDTRHATYAGAMECINNGVTTVIGYEHNVNTHDHAYAGVEGMVEAGIRGVYALGMGQAPLAPRVFNDTASYVPLLNGLKERYFKDAGLLSLGVAPVELFMAPLEVVEEQFKLARSYDAQLTLHANAVQSGHGEINMLDEAGLLGPDIVFVHGNTSSDHELRRVADVGAAVSAGIEVEIGMALGTPSLASQRRVGLHPTIGVDSVGCCGGGLVGQMRLGMQTVALSEAQEALAAGKNPEALAITSKEVLRWGTINGAKALHMEDRLGSITVGKQADLVLIRTNSPDMAGWDESEPEAAIITQSSVADIDLVMIAGVIRKRAGRLMTPNWPEKLSAITASTRRIIGQARQSHGGLIPSPPPELPAGHGW
ncbi:amidohydrolase family protein [Paenarthrobacter sp. RAF54_2]|uniref:amidohydrolase family protein n=1 Tax=Paenarthrobacter sp. RAF54_2 TaxID=3233061 RepID=UPI003F9503E6